MKIPNPILIKETYELITDGKGDSLKMPSVAEFLKIYKEKERLLTKKISDEKQIEYKNNINYAKSAQMFTRLKNTIKNKPSVTTNLCSFPVDGIQDGRKFTLTRDEMGRDWVKFNN